MRPDLEIIAALVNRGARVLDLGCGSGELLKWLAAEKGVNGYGIEKDPVQISACVRAGVNVIEHDLDEGLSRFPDSSFDMVVMTETLQAVTSPSELIDEMLRIGQECVVTFPNFGHWRCRLHLAALGRMPVASHLPHQWYDTPEHPPVHLPRLRASGRGEATADHRASCCRRRLPRPGSRKRAPQPVRYDRLLPARTGALLRGASPSPARLRAPT